jgi:CRISPR-associated endonuclease/helicase Cas3
VKAVARRFADSIGLPERLAKDVALAAGLHDIGKVDPRFQRMLVGGSEVRHAMLTAPIAKSAVPTREAGVRQQARRRAGYPVGYRHELLSLALAASNPEVLEGASDPDLVLHLVSSHHGWCRPFPPALDDPEEIEVNWETDGVRLAASTRHRLARIDSGVADRYFRLVDRYGWWGLAWLEAVVRLADHRASEAERLGGQVTA